MRKQGNALVSDEPEAAEEFAKIQEGAQLVVEVHQPRSLHQLRKWWKMMSILASNMPVFADKEEVSALVLIACRECNWVRDPKTGSEYPQARSIAFEKMDEGEFLRLWRKAKDYIVSEWLPIGTEKLQREIDDFFAGPDERARRASLGKRVVRELEAA